jgi:putative ABC transport system permease protein
LLGLASYTAEQRTREISVRKVVGASVGDIVLMLTKDFVFLVLIAAIPAFVAAWYFMREWLTNFEYHTELNYFVFAGALILTTLITLLTTGYHALRAAHTNPAEALKYE